MTDLEKIKEAVELLLSCSNETLFVSTVRTYYHDLSLYDLAVAIEEVHIDGEEVYNRGY